MGRVQYMYCILKNCKTNNRKNPKNEETKETQPELSDISFHTFPQDESLRNAWEKAIINRMDMDEQNKPSSLNISHNARLCSEHFTELDYYNRLSNAKRKRLLPKAIPSIFEDAPVIKKSKFENTSQTVSQLENTPTKALASSTIEAINCSTMPNARSPNSGRLPLSPMTIAISNQNSPAKNYETSKSGCYTYSRNPIPQNRASVEETILTSNVTSKSHQFSRKRLFLETESCTNRSPTYIKKLLQSNNETSVIKSIKAVHLNQPSLNHSQDSITPASTTQGNTNSFTLNNSQDTYNQSFSTPLELSTEPSAVEIGIQVSVVPLGKQKLRQRTSVARKQGRIISKLKEKISKLQNKVKDLSLKVKKKNPKKLLCDQITKVENGCENGSLRAKFIMEQVMAFGKKKIKFQETTLKMCCIWSKKSPSAYRYAKELGFLHLPDPKTLKRYLGASTGETGITTLVKSRLNSDFKQLELEHQKYGSLIVDEMSIHSKYVYDRKLDKFFGENETTAAELGVTEALATHLLCFLFQGLSRDYRIPVAYFFTARLDAKSLHKYTCDVICEIEKAGFVVKRLVSDNARTNVASYKMFGNGQLLPEVEHPNDSSKTLLLAFDQSHLIKNIRNQHLDRDIDFIGLTISSEFLRTLYKIQKGSIVKIVRFLSRKYVYPNNIEKMNVGRAVRLFSPEVTSALKTTIRIEHLPLQERENLEATIYFMEMVRKWYDIHDICNRDQAIRTRNENKIPFMDVNDERLTWLTDEFLPFIEMLQANGTTQMSKFSEETYEALCLTTKSTVLLIKHLLTSGFLYVLTSKASSDAIEMFFSHVRQMGGYNNTMDVQGCVNAIESTLKIGIIKPSKYANATKDYELQSSSSERLKEVQDLAKLKKSDQFKDDSQKKIPSCVLEILKRIEKVNIHDSCPVSIRNTAVAMIAGYIVRVCEENSSCPMCLDLLYRPRSNSQILMYINYQDRGGLRYPSNFLINILLIVTDFVNAAMPSLPRQNTLAILESHILPYFTNALKCECSEYQNLSVILLKKYLRPLLDNYGKDITDVKERVKKFKKKPLSRKYLTL